MLELTIPNMNCGGCAKSVARACATVDPTAKIDFDVPKKRVMIESSAPRDQFEAVLAKAGFPAG